MAGSPPAEDFAAAVAAACVARCIAPTRRQRNKPKHGQGP